MNAINGIQGNCYLPKCLVVILCDPADMLCAEAIMPSCKSYLITPQFYVGIYDKKIISYLNDLKSMSVQVSLSFSFHSLLLFRSIMNLNQPNDTQLKPKFYSNLYLLTHTYRQTDIELVANR